VTLISFAAAYQDSSWHHSPLFELTNRRLRRSTARGTPDIRIDGTLIPRLVDHHVHLGLVDPVELLAGGITHAIDLGWDPHVAHGWTQLKAPVVTIAGALISCVGGYPKNAGWGPPASTREVDGQDAAAAAVAEQQAAGASVIKVTLNSDAGPTPSDALLRELVAAARARDLPVYAHAQGEGQAERAFTAGVDVLAHAPFSEALSDELLTAMAANRMRWVSTMRIHGWGSPTAEFEVASDNIRRFAAAGGQVLYGTDAGNGPLTVGVNAHELAALADAGVDLLPALTTAAPGERTHPTNGPEVVAVVAGIPPTDTAALPGWLGTARGVSVESFQTEGFS
jgi:amidohydrolase family protein